MKKKFGIVVGLVAASLALSGCKKKSDGQEPAAGKPTEGTTAAGSAGSSGTTPTPAGGSATDPAKAAPASADGTAPAPAGGSAADLAKVAAPATKNLLDTAKQAGSFTTFLKAVDAAGLADQLNGAGPFTVFAPTDDAFAKLPPKDLDTLLADKAKLGALLQFHVITGNLSAKDLATAKTEKSVGGPELAIDAAAGLKIAGATVVKPDLVATNGVIHGIDTVLVPPTK